MSAAETPPYYGQWESPGLIGDIITGACRAEDDPAWAYALAREDDLSVTEDDGSGQEQEARDVPYTAYSLDDGNDWFVG